MQLITFFIVGGVSAAVSKTAAAPIERVKLLIQNQVRLSSSTHNICLHDYVVQDQSTHRVLDRPLSPTLTSFSNLPILTYLLQDEMLKSGRLDRKYNGIIECFSRTAKVGCIPINSSRFKNASLICTTERGCHVPLARQYRQRHPILPNPSSQLRVQRYLQVNVCVQERS